MKPTDTEILVNFRQSLYKLFPARRDACFNLLDAVTSYGQHCDSVVQLSNSKFFERQYSSITDAISDGLPNTNWEKIMKLTFDTTSKQESENPYCFLTDCTPNPRPHAKKLADKTITHYPNPAPGNKPICVGHQYSMLALLPDELSETRNHWLLPLSVERVSSEQKGNEVGLKQLVHCIDTLDLSEKFVISIADSLYGTEQCRKTALQKENLVHIFRINTKRRFFTQPYSNESRLNKQGRKKAFGKKMNLKDPSTHPTISQQANTTWTSRKGKTYKVNIKCWKDMLLRGSKRFRSENYPMNLIQVTIRDPQKKEIFKHPLWLAIFGKRRHEVSLVDAYHRYTDRYDIEHLFRFGKNKLLFDAYQTPYVDHEELWWKFCSLAYIQLYLARSLGTLMPYPWERYLPEYKNSQSSAKKNMSPSQTQRGFENLLGEIGSPAKACVARGNPCGRMQGQSMEKLPDSPIIFKTKKAKETYEKMIFQGLKNLGNSPNPQKIDQLVELVQKTLNEINFSPQDFTKKLLEMS